MSEDRRRLEAGIQALEAQRPVLGDTVVDAALVGLHAKLDALSALADEPAQTLKQVTILFLDVVGSTTLSQRLDPEDISAVMDDALARGTALVQAHRGKVLQYAGDNILAVFGGDLAAEDDAERAVHCGLALLELGRVLGAEVQARHGHAGFNVRVGLHTGGVLLGGGWTPKAASAASPSTSPRAWSRPPRPVPCASTTTPTPRCAACSRWTRRSPWPSRASTPPSRATSCCAPSHGSSASAREASKAWPRR